MGNGAERVRCLRPALEGVLVDKVVGKSMDASRIQRPGRTPRAVPANEALEFDAESTTCNDDPTA
ncbi:MAG: hypothetical protein AMXMBFR66_29800 [Pseudomonadota bacterium]